MINRLKLFPYMIIGICIIIIDQLTKYIVLKNITSALVINNYLSLEVIINRGISWGLFHSINHVPFLLVTALSGFFIGIILLFARHQWRNQYTLWGETLIISGALSNMIDRFIYKGVVDFIVLSYNEWSWPVFNIADCCIVLGTFLIIIKLRKQ